MFARPLIAQEHAGWPDEQQPKRRGEHSYRHRQQAHADRPQRARVDQTEWAEEEAQRSGQSGVFTSASKVSRAIVFSDLDGV